MTTLLTVPYTFQYQTGVIPLSELDSNFTFITTYYAAAGNNDDITNLTALQSISSAASLTPNSFSFFGQDSSAATGVNGGALVITAGSGGIGISQNGGAVNITGGSGSTNATSAGTGGQVLIQGGAAGANASVGGSAGDVSLVGGNGNTLNASAVPGVVYVQGGAATVAGQKGGAVSIAAASGYNSATNSTGGNLTLAAGLGYGFGNSNGQIRVTFYPQGAGGTTSNGGIVFLNTSTEVARFDTTGNFVMTGSTGLGYAAGSGGAVTQLTSRTTPVTLNKYAGAITVFAGTGTTTGNTTFTVNNSLIAATDNVIINIKSGTANLYNMTITSIAAGSFKISLQPYSGTAADSPVIAFTILKSAIA